MKYPASMCDLRCFSLLLVVGGISAAAMPGDLSLVAEYRLDLLAPSPDATNPTCEVLSPDGRNLYVSWAGMLSFDRVPPQPHLSLARHDPPAPYTGFLWQQKGCFSPDGQFLYVDATDDTSRRLEVYRRTLTTGELVFVQLVRPSDVGLPGWWNWASPALSTDAQHLYVVAYQGLYRFTRDETSGVLSGFTSLNGFLQGQPFARIRDSVCRRQSNRIHPWSECL